MKSPYPHQQSILDNLDKSFDRLFPEDKGIPKGEVVIQGSAQRHGKSVFTQDMIEKELDKGKGVIVISSKGIATLGATFARDITPTIVDESFHLKEWKGECDE